MRNLFIFGALVCTSISLIACDGPGKVGLPKPKTYTYKPKEFKFEMPKLPDFDFSHLADIKADGIDLAKLDALLSAKPAACFMKEDEMDLSSISEENKLEIELMVLRQDVTYNACENKSYQGGLQSIKPTYNSLTIPALNGLKSEVKSIKVRNERSCSELNIIAEAEPVTEETFGLDENSPVRAPIKNKSFAKTNGQAFVSINDYIATLGSSLGVTSGTNVIEVTYFGDDEAVLATQKLSLNVTYKHINIGGHREMDICQTK